MNDRCTDTLIGHHRIGEGGWAERCVHVGVTSGQLIGWYVEGKRMR